MLNLREQHVHITAQTLDQMLEMYLDNGYKEDQAQFSLNLFYIHEKLFTTRGICSVAETVKHYSTYKTSVLQYEFLKDLLRALMDKDASINFSKYSFIIGTDYDNGHKTSKIVRETLNGTVVRNPQTEFSILLDRLGIDGLLTVYNVIKEIH